MFGPFKKMFQHYGVTVNANTTQLSVIPRTYYAGRRCVQTYTFGSEYQYAIVRFDDDGSRMVVDRQDIYQKVH